MKHSNIIHDFKTNNQSVIQATYLKYREEFYMFMKKRYNTDKELAAEIYQEAFYVLYNNILKGKLTELTAGLKTYLFQVGRNIFLNELKRNKRNSDLEDYKIENKKNEEQAEDESDKAAQIVRKALEKLGEKCRELLKLFYFERCKNEEIMQRLNYATIDSVKTQKYKCFQQLKKDVTGKYHLADIFG